MKIVVMGAGALGTVIAAYLARGGNDVALIARGERARMLAENGVSITGHETFTTEMDIVVDPATITSADVFVLGVKTYDTEAALDAVAHMSVGAAFSIQNGVIKNEQLVDAFGKDAVLGAICMFGGAIDPDGAANYMMPAPTVIGEWPDGSSDRVDGIVDKFTAAGLEAAASDHIATEEWSKFVGWLGLSGMAVLTRRETHKFLSDPDTALITARIMREVAQVPASLDIALKPGPPFMLDAMTGGSEDDAVALLQRRGQAQSQTAPDFRQSMLQDIDKGKSIEVEETFGHVMRLARQHSIDMPTVETVYHALAGINRLQG
jgi:2-dehydropantoate 2-reductase